MSAATPFPYDQPINAHYGEIFVRHLRQKNEPPPAGWQRAVLELPPNAARVDPKEEEIFMEELLRLIRERCAATDPKDTSPQGSWIEDGSEVVNKYLRGGKLKLYPGNSMLESVWIDTALDAGPIPPSGFFRT
jgi:hypothetical protein